jgi:quaternary ammonium compound-resistance protein SugE
MAWTYLVVAGLFECFWAIGLKYTYGFTKLIPSLLTVSSMAISFLLLSVAMKTIPVGTAYAVWTGIGAVGVAIMGMVLFGESRDILRIMCLLLIVAGIVGLKLVSSWQGAS